MSIDVPKWASLATLAVLLAGTLTAVVLWAGDAHSDNRTGIVENRVRLDDSAGDLKRIESKLDRLIMHLLP